MLRLNIGSGMLRLSSCMLKIGRGPQELSLSMPEPVLSLSIVIFDQHLDSRLPNSNGWPRLADTMDTVRPGRPGKPLAGQYARGQMKNNNAVMASERHMLLPLAFCPLVQRAGDLNN